MPSVTILLFLSAFVFPSLPLLLPSPSLSLSLSLSLLMLQVPAWLIMTGAAPLLSLCSQGVEERSNSLHPQKGPEKEKTCKRNTTYCTCVHVCTCIHVHVQYMWICTLYVHVHVHVCALHVHVITELRVALFSSGGRPCICMKFKDLTYPAGLLW